MEFWGWIIIAVVALVVVVAWVSAGSRKRGGAERRQPEGNAGATDADELRTAAAAGTGDEGELVAAIAAAVALVMEPGTGYTIKRVTRISGGRPAWATAARNEQIYSRF